MDIKELKNKLTLEDIIEILEDLGAEPRESNNLNVIQCKTICHCGNSHKLYLYKDSLNLHCYTNCGTMDIIQLVCNVLDCSIGKAIHYIQSKLNIHESSFKFGFDATYEDDVELLDSILDKNKVVKKEEWKPFKCIDEKVLKQFYDYYHKAFYEDNISFEVLRKFEIKYDILNQRIIIPHRGADGSLIAVRCRNLLEDLVNNGQKYMPIIYKNEFLSAPTNQYFYGLYQNKDNIKACKKVIIVEAEKSVMQYETMFPNSNITLALSSSNLSNFQIEILKELGVEEVIIALDKEFDYIGTDDEKLYFNKIKKTIIDKLNFCKVSLIWDTKNLLNKKDSPTDRGREIFLELYKNRKYIN